VGLHGGIWLAFFGGALVGGAATLRLGRPALLVPVAALAALCLVALLRRHATH